MKIKDLTEKHFLAQAARHGWKPTASYGQFYKDVGHFYKYFGLATTPVVVSVRSAGPRRRAQLAFLLAFAERQEAADKA